MIPARGPTGSVEGLVIPNFDNTSRVISERRIQTLNVLSRAIAEARTAEQIASIALPAFENNNDTPFMVVYLASPAEELYDHESAEHQSQRTRSTTDSSRRLSTTSEETCLEFVRAANIGCISIQETDPYVPLTVISDRSVALEEYSDSHGLKKAIRMAHCYDDAVLISVDNGLRDILPNITPNAFGDLTKYVAVMPIRSSSEDRTHGVIVIGLNSRLEFTKPYKDYINTIRGLFATGLASVKLHREQMARAQYLAALNKRKNDELQVLLKKRTEELRSAELKMSTAFDCCPTGIWIANEKMEIVFLNPAYYQITGLDQDAPLSSWIDVVHPDDVERVANIYAKSKEQRCKAEFRVLTGGVNADGTPAVRWVESTAGPQYDSLGQVCGTIMDITLRKEKEEYQVRRAEDALERKRQQEYFIDMVCSATASALSPRVRVCTDSNVSLLSTDLS
jgi:PAS domain S-box-containing protein